MFNDFLSSLLQIVIVIDVLGVIAYFALTALKPRRAPSSTDEQAASTAAPAVAEVAPDLRAQGAARPASVRRGPLETLRSRLWPRGQAGRDDAGLQVSLAHLHRVLYSYQEGLA